MLNYLRKAKRHYQKLPVGIKAASWFVICSFIQRAISVITMPIFTRLLSPEEYGQISVFQSWLGVATIIVSLQLSAGVYAQGLIKFDSEREVFSSSLQGLTLTLCIIWTLIYLLCPSFFSGITKLTGSQMLYMMVIVWYSAAFGFWASEQRVKYRYKALVIVTLAIAVISPVLCIYMVIHARDKVTARIAGRALVAGITGVSVFYLHMKRGKVFYNKRFWLYALSFNIPLVPHYLSQTILNNADRIMISDMINASKAGIYSIAYSVSMLMTLFNSALMQTMEPWIYKKIKEKKIKEIKNVAYPALLFIIVLNLLLIAFSPEIIKVFAPPEYFEAIWVVPPVAMSVVFLFSYDLFAKIEFYYEKTRFIMIASMGGALLNVFLNYIFIKKYGYMAAGYTTLFCYIIYAIGHFGMMWHICKVNLNGEMPYSAKILLAIYVSFMFLGFVIESTYQYIYIRYSFIIIILLILIVLRKKIFFLVKHFADIRNGKF